MLRAWAILMAGFLAAPGEVPRAAWVAVDAVDLLDEPDDGAFSTGRLKYGQRVTIRRDGPDGWATLDPPRGAFSLIDEADIEEIDARTGRVTARYATVRPGRDGARVPGPARVSLRKGTVVRLLDRRPLVLRQGGESRTWIPIEPPEAEVRFVRASALDDGPAPDEAEPRTPRDRLAANPAGADDLTPGPQRPRARVAPAPSAIAIDGDFASARSDGEEIGVSAATAESLRRIGDRHRALLRKPLDQWDLAPVEEAYRGLLAGAAGADRAAIEGRIAKVRRQRSAAEAAQTMEALIQGSRSRDAGVADVRRKAADPASDADLAFDASGLLQATSKRSEGRRLHVLLGDDGGVVCYLVTPAGIAAKDFMSRRVGVRGQGRFDEGLQARLIQVRDLEILRGEP